MTESTKGMTVEEAIRKTKKLDLKEEISKHYKWAIENPTILTVSALQDEWIRWVEDEILPKWEADLNRLKTDRMALAKLIDDIDTEIKSLEGTRFAHYGRNKIRAQCLRDWLPRIKQLESKREMR